VVFKEPSVETQRLKSNITFLNVINNKMTTDLSDPPPYIEVPVTKVNCRDVPISDTTRYSLVKIGLDYRGMQLPPGTTDVGLFNQEDGGQVVRYWRILERTSSEDIERIGRFSNEIIKEEPRPSDEHIEISDLMPR